MNVEIEQPSTAESEVAPVDTRSIIEAAVSKQREAIAPADPVADAPEPVEAQASKAGRDEKGRFAPKEGEPPAPVEAKETPETPKEGEPAKVIARPPPGWSPASKAEFDKLPEAVRNDVAKREQEINNGFAKLAEYKPIERFVEMAKSSGTTLDKALENYVGIENTLRRDPFAGFEAISKNIGADPLLFAQAIIARYGGSPQTGTSGAGQRGYQQPQIDPSAIVRQAKAEMQAEMETRETQTAIQSFQTDPANRFFDNVRDDMAALLSAGKADTLKDAYEKACWLNPETRAILLREQSVAQAPKPMQAVQQARQAAKAVGGAPSPGFNPGSQATPSNQPLRETIRQAIAAQR